MSWLRRTPLGEAQWVVIDCETTGLDMRRDRLLSVGAVALDADRVMVGRSLHLFVQQAVPSAPDNILVHGISGDAQRTGRALVEVIEELERFTAGRVPVGFHAGFDAVVLRRHGLRLREGWLDLARVAPALFPGRSVPDTLDAWLARFGIEAVERHSALGDAVSTAQLLLVVLAEAKRQRLETVQALRKVQRASRWLAGR